MGVKKEMEVWMLWIVVGEKRCMKDSVAGGFFFSSRRRHTRFLPVSWARRCVEEADNWQIHCVRAKSSGSSIAGIAIERDSY